MCTARSDSQPVLFPHGAVFFTATCSQRASYGAALIAEPGVNCTRAGVENSPLTHHHHHRNGHNQDGDHSDGNVSVTATTTTYGHYHVPASKAKPAR